MQQTENTAIVLRYANYKDNDRMLTLLSPTRGKMEVLSRGCRRPKSPLLNASEIFALGDFQLYIKQDRATLVSANLLETFYPLRADFDRLSVGIYLLNLAEAAAEAVGANALLVRVGAYYHDIGKLIRPLYFKENQMGENPHDKTDPRVSTAILTEHTRDGVELARRHHLPEPIIDMIRQHHGDTPVMYFYAKAVKMFGEENVDIRDFRYDGPKPQTSEAAILMLSDTVEAAVRALPDPTQEKISALIRKLVRGKMEDGQLDECTLTFRDIGKICSAFETVLQGVFHERIEYPSVDLSRAQHYGADKTSRKQTVGAKQTEVKP